MKYLKKFENSAAYEAAESGLILPNVSLCVSENEVHYKPYVAPPTPPTPTETRLVCKYNVEDTSYDTYLCDNTTNFSAMEIDGVELPSVVSSYAFSTTGEHTVKYTLTDPTSIGEYAFQYSGSLTSIDIPDSVTSIGSYAFLQCTSLSSVTIGSGVTSIDDGTFSACGSLTSIVIPNSVTSIGGNVFEDCYSLTSCTIGSGVTNIGGFVFYSTNLDSITSLATTAPLIIANDTFNGLTYNGTLYVPIGSSGYDRWMDDMDALGLYNWTKVEQ